MEILSDATFKGNVTFNKNVAVTGESNLMLSDRSWLTVRSSDYDLIEASPYCGLFLRNPKICGGACVTGSVSISDGNFSVTRKSESNPSFSVGRIIANGTEFKSVGGVFVNGDFSITRSGESNPIIQTNIPYEFPGGYGGYYALYVNGSEFVKDLLKVGGPLYVQGDASINSKLSTGILSTGSLCAQSIELNGDKIHFWSGLKSYVGPSIFTSPSIPANCTAFEFTGTIISDTKKTHMIQVQNTSTGKSVIAETWMTTNKRPAMSFAGCTSAIAAGTYTAMVL